MTDHLLKEVDDALKWQRLQQLWHRSAQQIVVGVSLVAIALIALLFYQQEQRDADRKQSDMLLRASAALAKQQPLPHMQEMTGAQQQIAALFAAAKHVRQNEHKSALQHFSKAYQQNRGSDLLAQFACVQTYGLAPETVQCEQPSAFEPLRREYEIIHLLISGDTAQANQHLQLASTSSGATQSRRLSYLQDYLRAHLPNLSPDPLPANSKRNETQP